tara:strand:+ start:1250 stop:2029 length:780 start_codon:yes stop_codon:yes gene_type:complete
VVKAPVHIKDLVPDSKNRRKHTPRNVGMIVDALNKVGAGRSIVIDENNEVLAGNATIEAAGEAGITKLKVVETNGLEVIAVRRTGLTDDQKRDLAMYDNRAAELAEWDVEQLTEDISDNIDLSAFFHEGELNDLLQEAKEEGIHSNQYSSKVDSPIYEPNRDKPLVSELYDTKKYKELEVAIMGSELSERDKDFLIVAAQRHVVFDYSKIADFYAHSDKAVQGLMEDSALVIIDFNKAIEKGFVKLYEDFQELANNDGE